MKKLIDIEPKPKTVVELFEGHPERWGKHFHFSNNGSCSDRTQGSACCLIGAALLVYGCHTDAFREAAAKLNEKVGGSVFQFNDGCRAVEQIIEVARAAGV